MNPRYSNTNLIVDVGLKCSGKQREYFKSIPEVPLSVPRVDDVIFRNIRFCQDAFNGEKFTGCAFKGCYFENINLIDITKGVCFNNCVFVGCDFSGGVFPINIKNRFVDCSFYSIDFTYRQLSCSEFKRCSFSNVDFRDSYLPMSFDVLNGFYDCSNIYSKCPEAGSFLGYKSVRVFDNLFDSCGYVVLTLFIPSCAKRSSATGEKCRASKAYVVGADLSRLYKPQTIHDYVYRSSHDPKFED